MPSCVLEWGTLILAQEEDIRGQTRGFYSRPFTDEDYFRLRLEEWLLQRLSVETRVTLDQICSEEEICMDVFSVVGDKAPRPDCFPVLWELQSLGLVSFPVGQHFPFVVGHLFLLGYYSLGWRASTWVTDSSLETAESIEGFHLENLSWQVPYERLCVLCGKEEEFIDHIFVGCSYASLVWTTVAASAHGTIPLYGELCLELKWLTVLMTNCPGGNWAPTFRRSLSLQEMDQFQSLLSVLQDFKPTPSRQVTMSHGFGDRSLETINLVVAVEELNGLSSQELSKLLKESENFTVHVTRNGSLIQIDMEKLASSLPLHLIAVLLSPGGDDMRLIYFLRGIRLLRSLSDLASRQTRLEQILLEEVKVIEQVLDLVFYVLLMLASYGQVQELVQVLLAHPKVDVFMDVTFDAVHVDIRFLSVKLSTLSIDVLTNKSSLLVAERTAKYICQQCEASLQFVLSLCQQKIFRDRILANKELCRNGGILSLAQKILNLEIPQCFKDSSEIVAAVSRQKSKVLSILLQLCEAENVSYLDEVAGSQKSMDLAKSVVLEILDLLKAAFSREAKQLSHPLGKSNPKGLILLNSMRLADIFSDDSNFRSFFMANTTKVLVEILAMPHAEFFSSWCSTDVPMMEEDSNLEYDPFVASGIALSFFTGSTGNPFEEPIVLSEATVACHGSPNSMPVSYAQQRISYLVKIIANLQCFVPSICEDEEKDLFLNKFLECLHIGSAHLASNIPITCDMEKAATIRKNLGSLSAYAESLIPHLLIDDDVQLLREFLKQLLQSIPSLPLETYDQGHLNKDVGGVPVTNTSESCLMLQDSVDWVKISNSGFNEVHQSKTGASFQGVHHSHPPAHEVSGSDGHQCAEEMLNL
ncbi:hypothetical protein Taro_009289 [Colocasia esculenta]|uniref:Uncharacterized protein n=1 Tax=Colocasia esculenta TaxID=4460 RepID=A0A843U9J9_COLES|nr:hypothetical protein [Colocasia esculenta]